MKVNARLVGLTCLLLFALSATAAEDRFDVFSKEGSKIGSLIVNRSAANVTIRYGYKNNGRGPDSVEHIQMDERGFPRRWAIEYSSMGGVSSTETFVVERGRFTWTVDGTASSRPFDPPRMYVPAHSSPWSLAVYAGALHAAPGHTIATVDGGALKLEKLREVTLGDMPLGVYAITDQEMQRQLVFLDTRGALIATGDGLVRHDLEPWAAELAKIGQHLETERFQALRQSLGRDFDTPVRVRAVRVFDPATGRLGAPSDVTFYRGKITGVLATDEPFDSEVVMIDGQGGVLVPGLHDMHAHTGSSLTISPLAISLGITTFREMGAPSNAAMLEEMAGIDSGRLIGPRIVPAGFIEGQSAYSARYGFVAASEAEALQAVHWYAARGYAQIKLYNSIDADWVPAITRAAHRLGLPVSGHVPAFSTPDAMIAAGYDELTHMNQLVLGWLIKPGEDMRTLLRMTALRRGSTLDLDRADVQKTIAAMKERNIAFDPTLSIMERILLARTGQTPSVDAAIMEHLPKRMQQDRMEVVLNIKNAADDQAYRDSFDKMVELLGLLHRNGITLLPGSDYYDDFQLHRELELWVRSGLTPSQALEAATLTSARYLGQGDEWGSIERGKAADFFLIAGDPTRDITAIRNVRMTVARGTVYFPSEIHEAFGIRPFASSPPVMRNGQSVRR